jgi:hypothetical protein
MMRLFRGLLAAALLTLVVSPAVLAQSGGRSQPERVERRLVPLDTRQAEDVRNDFRQRLSQYPPALAQVFKLDSTLMTNEAYLAPYPSVAAFLQDHPEVARYPEYFLDFVNDRQAQRPFDASYALKQQALGAWQDVMAATLVFLGFVTFILTVAWLIRYIVSHRRWLRATKVQTDLHSRLLERFGSSEELLAYLQSPAGRGSLGTLPSAADAPAVSAITAPLGRILLSVQAGVVLACGGLGLLALKHYVIPEVADMLLVFGVLALSLGLGFVLAAAASYMLSQKLGLLTPSARVGGGGA